MSASAGPVSRSARVYATLRAEILEGGFAPGQALKPQDLADRLGVSLAVVREVLLRLVGEGLAERRPNRGFTAPAADDRRWEELGDARAAVEPQLLRLAVERGDLAWEAGVRETFRTLDRTPVHDGDGPQVSEAWSHAHHRFHRALLEGCGNPVLLETFERLWRLSELARRWSALGSPGEGAPRRARRPRGGRPGPRRRPGGRRPRRPPAPHDRDPRTPPPRTPAR